MYDELPAGKGIAGALGSDVAGALPAGKGIAGALSSDVVGALPPGAATTYTEEKARKALHYTRLNLKRSEVTSGPESDKRVKGAMSKAYAIASKIKASHEMQAIKESRDVLLDQ